LAKYVQAKQALFNKALDHNVAPLSLPILVGSNESGIYFSYRNDRSFAKMFLCTKSRT
jgi:hypothetical protein